MIRNFFIHGVRIFTRQKSYFFLNITGLSIGIATSLFIFIYILNELNYDNFHDKKDRIYRLILDGKIGEQEVLTTASSSPVGPYMHAEFPEVEEFCRMNPWGETVLKFDHNIFSEDSFVEVDSSFFSIFSIQLLRGDRSNVLNRPHTLVLSQSTAEKMFGNIDVIGRMIKVGTDTTLYTLTGIMQDFPRNSHFDANVLASFMTNRRSDDNNWLANSFTTYLLLKPGADPQGVNDKLPDMIVRNVGSLIEEYFGVGMEEFISSGNRYNMHLQELGDIHLNPDIDHQQKPAANPKYLFIFGSIALLIIIIASINFMNLSTAQAARRAREVGIKKVSGSSRNSLIQQFLFESVLLTFLSLIIALVIVWISLPYINQIIGTELSLDLFSKWYLFPVLLGFSILVGIFAGSYPAFYLSSFSPVTVLKSGITGSKVNTRLRSLLVVVQFSISVVLIIGTLIMFKQINYMLNKDLGFNKERVLVISRAGALGNRVESFKSEVKAIPGVLHVSSSTAVPGRNNNTNGYMIEGKDESFLLETNWVDYAYFDTYDLDIDEGRFFSRDFETDKEAVVINQSAVKQFGLDPVLEQRFINRDNDEETYMRVIGVAKNFHFRSLHSAITPYIFRFKNEDMHWGYISVKLDKNFTSQT
ncbi:MAG: ABC transporter permease, partial [Bacteroidota bacterium]